MVEGRRRQETHRLHIPLPIRKADESLEVRARCLSYVDCRTPIGSHVGRPPASKPLPSGCWLLTKHRAATRQVVSTILRDSADQVPSRRSISVRRGHQPPVEVLSSVSRRAYGLRYETRRLTFACLSGSSCDSLGFTCEDASSPVLDRGS